MTQIHINFTLPLVFSYIPLILLGYVLTGNIVWFIQNFYATAKSTFNKDGLKNKSNFYQIIGYIFAWPYYLSLQFRVKVLKTPLDKVMHLSLRQEYFKANMEIQDSIKGLKGGELIRVTYLPNRFDKTNTDKITKEGFVERKFGMLNCSNLIFDGKVLRTENGMATSLISAPIEVLI